MVIGILAGVWDWKYRRIPNWLTVSGALCGIAANTGLHAWPGLRSALLGLLLGLGLLLPLVLVRSIGAGDWKLAGALGACFGPDRLLSVLAGTVLLAGVMALCIIVYKRQLKRTIINIGHILAALITLRMPPVDVSLDNPKATKIPLGVAMAGAVLIYAFGMATGRL